MHPVESILTKEFCHSHGIYPIDDIEGIFALSYDVPALFLPYAYSAGVFPWPQSDEKYIPWTSPLKRGIIKTDSFHLSKTLKKQLRQNKYKAIFNRNFTKVMRLARQKHIERNNGEWITPAMLAAYEQLFHNDYAFCVEIEDETNQLVGGIYGVCIGERVSGESMFYLENGGSKLALYALLKALKNARVPQLDIQMVTPATQAFGGIEVSKVEFLDELIKLNPNKKREDIFPSSINLLCDY